MPPISGGAVQIYIDGILPYLCKEHNVTVYTVKHKDLKSEEIIDNVRYIRLDAIPKELYIENVIEHIDTSYDLVHVFNRPIWVNRLSQKLTNSRFGLSIHNEMFRTKKIAYNEGEKCIERVEYINTVSKFIADGITTLYPEAEDKVRVVYSGVDLNTYKPTWSTEGIENKKNLKLKYGLQNYKIILFVGRLCEKKGVDILLEAMEKVMNKREHTALMIIGSSWFGENTSNKYTQKLKEIGERLRGPIIFTGFLNPDQVREHYNLADIFVCPSQWNEPLARVHYEAMAAGLPIITTDRGGNAEVIRGYGNGIIIKAYNSPEIMADRILYLLNSPRTARQMGIKGRKLVEKKFNFKRVANELLQEFSEIQRSVWTEEGIL